MNIFEKVFLEQILKDEPDKEELMKVAEVVLNPVNDDE